MVAEIDWFGPLAFEAGLAALTILLLFGVWWLLKRLPMPEPRRFPPPWSIEEQAACFTVRDPDFASYFLLF